MRWNKMMVHKELFYHYDRLVKKLKDNEKELCTQRENHTNKISDLGLNLLYDGYIYLSGTIKDDNLSNLSLVNREDENKIEYELSYFIDTDRGKFKVSLMEIFENVTITKFVSKVKNNLKFVLIKLGNTNKDTFQNKDVTVAKYIIYENMIDGINVNDFPYEYLNMISPQIIYSKLYKEVKYKDNFEYDDMILRAQ
jgi:hypothetical protein